MTPLDKLKQLLREEQLRKYPSVPENYHRAIKLTDKTANGLTKCVSEYLRLKGYWCERTGNEGRVIDTRKTYTDVIGQQKTIGSVKRIKSSGALGTSDLKAIINGQFIAIEIKIGKDRMSDSQKKYQEQVESAGGVYVVVKSFDQFVEWLNSLMNGNQ